MGNLKGIKSDISEMLRLLSKAKGKKITFKDVFLKSGSSGVAKEDVAFAFGKSKKTIKNIKSAYCEYDKIVCAYRVHLALEIGLKLPRSVRIHGLVGKKAIAVVNGIEVEFVNTEASKIPSDKNFSSIIRSVDDADSGDLSVFFGCSEISINEVLAA